MSKMQADQKTYKDQNTHKDQNTTMAERITDKAVLIALIAQIIFIMGMNLFRADTIIDFDSSSAYLHEMEMGSQGKIFHLEYSYQATMDLDSAAIISALLYHFTGDIFLSRGITNNLVVILYICIIYSILSRIGLSVRWQRFGILLFLIPYSMIMLGYWRMLFVGGGFFAFRALVPLLMISLIQDIETENGFGKYALRLILLLIIVFLGGLSSGAYLLMCAVCPLLLWEAVRAFVKGDFGQIRSKRLYLGVMAVFVSVAGIIAQKAVGFSSTADRKEILTSEKWIDAIFSCVAGLFELFGGLTTHEHVKLFSAEAAGTAVDFAVTCILITAIVYTIVNYIKRKEISNMNGYILSLMFVNACMFCFLDLKYGDTVFESRYLLVPMLPALIMVTAMMEDFPKKGKLNTFQVSTIEILVIGLFAASMLFGDAQWVYAKTALESDKVKELDRIIEEEGIRTAVIVGEDSKIIGRKIRVYGRDTHYIVVNDGAESAFRTIWGGTTRYLDNSMQTGKTAIIATPEGFATLPAYLTAGMSHWRDYDELQIHVADESRFDCAGGLLAEKDRVVDFPYSPGYAYDNASLDADGVLVMKPGGGILESSYASVSGTWRYTVYYEMKESSGDAYVEIRVGEDAPIRTDLDPSAGNVSVGDIVMTDAETVSFKIVAPQGTKIKRIEISRR